MRGCLCVQYILVYSIRRSETYTYTYNFSFFFVTEDNKSSSKFVYGLFGKFVSGALFWKNYGPAALAERLDPPLEMVRCI